MKGLIATYLITYGGALLAFFNPYYGLLAYICLAIIRPRHLWYWSVGDGDFSKVVGIAMLIGWAIHGFGKWEFGKARTVVYALMAFWFWSVVCASVAPNSDVAWAFVVDKSKIFLPFLMGMTLIDSYEKTRQLAWLLVLSQGYVAFELNLSYYDGFNRLEVLGFGGMDNNSFSISLVTLIGFSFFLGLHESKILNKLTCFLAAALMTHCCMLSMSRGAMLSLCVVGAVAAYFLSTQPKHWWALAVGCIVGLRLAGARVIGRFMSVFIDQADRDASAQSRVEMWAQCIQLMKENPLLGCGPDHWPLLASRFGWGHGKEAHTTWLQTGAEMGVVGLVFLMSFYVFAMIGLMRLWRSQRDADPDEWTRTSIQMVVSSLAGFMVAAQFVTLEGLETPYYVALFGAGILKLSGVASLARIDKLQDATLHRGQIIGVPGT